MARKIIDYTIIRDDNGNDFSQKVKKQLSKPGWVMKDETFKGHYYYNQVFVKYEEKQTYSKDSM
jgi:hypothetical protein